MSKQIVPDWVIQREKQRVFAFGKGQFNTFKHNNGQSNFVQRLGLGLLIQLLAEH